MNLWRICRAIHESTAFTGYGAEKAGGRWNFKGHPVVYTSENLSLSALELFVHVSPDTIPTDLMAFRASLPDSISTMRINETDLPKNWRDYPAPPALKEMGTDWIKSMKSVVLIVPSAINPQESNLLINPSHPEITKLKVDQPEPFHFDPRMFKK